MDGRRLDALVVPEVLRSLQPPELEAVIAAAVDVNASYTAVVRQRQAERDQAQYQAELARRRYEAVDPANRLVAGALGVLAESAPSR